MASNGPEYWLERAKEAQALAEETIDPEMKRLLLEIAEAYRRIARILEKGPETLNGT